MATTGSTLATTAESTEVEVEAPGMSRAQAQRLTERIRSGMESVGMMLLEAFNKRAHLALGYTTWESYAETEFKMSRQESYKQINKGKVVAAIAEVGGITKAKEAAPYVTIRQAQVLAPDAEVAAREINRDVQKGAEFEDAIQAAVNRRTERRAVDAGPVQQALPVATPPRRGAEMDEDELLASAADLRDRLRDVPALLKRQMSAFPKRDAETVDDLHLELRAWVVALSNFTNETTIKSINTLRAELFEWLVSVFRDSREDVGELAGVGEANVDYWRRVIRDLSEKGQRTPRKS